MRIPKTKEEVSHYWPSGGLSITETFATIDAFVHNRITRVMGLRHANLETEIADNIKKRVYAYFADKIATNPPNLDWVRVLSKIYFAHAFLDARKRKVNRLEVQIMNTPSPSVSWKKDIDYCPETPGNTSIELFTTDGGITAYEDEELASAFLLWAIETINFTPREISALCELVLNGDCKDRTKLFAMRKRLRQYETEIKEFIHANL